MRQGQFRNAMHLLASSELPLSHPERLPETVLLSPCGTRRKQRQGQSLLNVPQYTRTGPYRPAASLRPVPQRSLGLVGTEPVLVDTGQVAMSDRHTAHKQCSVIRAAREREKILSEPNSRDLVTGRPRRTRRGPRRV